MTRTLATTFAAITILVLSACSSALVDTALESAPPVESGQSETTTVSGITCTRSDRPEPAGGSAYSHPSQSFYAVGAEDMPTNADLEHLVTSDNAVVVSYADDLPDSSIAALQEWSGTIVAVVVVPATDGPSILAYTLDNALECDGVDTTRLSQFADTRPDRAVEEHDDEG